MKPVTIGIWSELRPYSPEIEYTFRVLMRIAGRPWRFAWIDADATQRCDVLYGPAFEHVESRCRISPAKGAWSDASPDIGRDGVDVLRALTGESGSPLDAVARGRWVWTTDVVWLCFGLLTGSEESGLPRDARDNLDASGTGLVQAALLDKPVVSLMARWLAEHVGESEPGSAAHHGSTLVLTHDVDYPEIIRAIEIARVLVGSGPGRLRRALSVASGKSHFWQFGAWMDLAESLGGHATFFFMARTGSLLRYATGEPDAFYDVADARFAALFEEMAERGHEVGLHLSYRSYEHPNRIAPERARLSRCSGRKIVGNRHHYWRLNPDDPHETLAHHAAAGLEYDSSLGFEFWPGFRRGICHPFRPYCRRRRGELPIVEIPPSWMDDHFDRRLAVNAVDAPDRQAEAIWNAVAETGGVCVLDYHVRGMNADLFPRYGPWLQRFLNGHMNSQTRTATAAEVTADYVQAEARLERLSPAAAAVGS